MKTAVRTLRNSLAPAPPPPPVRPTDRRDSPPPHYSVRFFFSSFFFGVLSSARFFVFVIIIFIPTPFSGMDSAGLPAFRGGTLNQRGFVFAFEKCRFTPAELANRFMILYNPLKHFTEFILRTNDQGVTIGLITS